MYYALLIDRRLEEEDLESLPECTFQPAYFESREELETFIENMEFPSYMFSHAHFEGDLDAKFAKLRSYLLQVELRPDEYQIVYAGVGGLRIITLDRDKDLRHIYEARIDTLLQKHKDAAQADEDGMRERAIRTVRELREKYGIA
jgi:hypothetical protein